MSDSPDIMKLVDEIHRLRLHNDALKRALEQQQVQSDRLLDKLPAWKKVHVTLSSADFLDTRGLVIDRLTRQMVGEMLQEQLYKGFHGVDGGVNVSGYVLAF